MDVFLYVCPTCHSWQAVSALQIGAQQCANAIISWADPKAETKDPLIVTCHNGCGLMIQVKQEDGLVVLDPKGTQNG